MERDLVAWIKSHVPSHPAVEVGIGDDAAILKGSGHRLIVTTDMLMDGVDFRLHECSPERAGRKALAVNLSDLAAMAATPIAAFVSLALPKQGGEQLAHGLYRGMFPIAQRYGLAIAGGDTNSWDGPLVINVTVLGERINPFGWLRSDARPDDIILVTGEFGGSILGRHLDFEPRVKEAQILRDHYQVHAATDVSDGLSLDLSNIIQASNCGAIVEQSCIPISSAARQCAASSVRSPLDHALSDGEDFELILTMPPQEAQRLLTEQPLGVAVTRIGRVIREPGLWWMDNSGQRLPLLPTGYQHTFYS